jgi:hypothetical protein
MNGHIITVIVVTASAVLNFLLTQPAGTFPSNVLLVIGATSVALTAVSRFLPSQGAPVQVEMSASSAPVHVTTAPKEDTDA